MNLVSSKKQICAVGMIFLFTFGCTPGNLQSNQAPFHATSPSPLSPTSIAPAINNSTPSPGILLLPTAENPTIINSTPSPAILILPTFENPTINGDGNIGSIPMPSLTPLPTVKYPSIKESLVDPTLVDLQKNPLSQITFVPDIPHVNAGFFDGEILYYLGTAWKNKQSWFPDTIFSYDVHTKTTSLFASSVLGESGVIDTLATSPDWITWDTHFENGSGWQLYAKNLKTGKQVLVDTEKDTQFDSIRGPYTSIYKDLLVWSTMRSGSNHDLNGTVMLMNLDTGEKRILAKKTNFDDGYVGIDQNYVVWSEERFDTDIVNIFLYDLETGNSRQLTDDDQSYEPQIQGDWVAWRHGFGEIGPIAFMNLKTNQRFQLNVQGDFIRMSDDLILWWDYMDPGGYVYDISKNLLYHPFNSYDYQTPLYIHDRYIVAETVPDQGTGFFDKLVIQTIP